MTKQAAIYVRVSTDGQTVENQVRELRQIAQRRGWQIVEVYGDHGISGSKGRDQRPGLDRMLNDASRRKFDVIATWAIDRLGRSLVDLLATVQTLEACGVRFVHRAAEPRHHDTGRQAHVSGLWCLQRV